MRSKCHLIFFMPILLLTHMSTNLKFFYFVLSLEKISGIQIIPLLLDSSLVSNYGVHHLCLLACIACMIIKFLCYINFVHQICSKILFCPIWRALSISNYICPNSILGLTRNCNKRQCQSS